MAPRQWAVLGGTGRRPTLAGQRGARLGCPCATSPRTCAEGATPHDERASGRDVGNVARFAGRMRGIVGLRRSLASAGQAVLRPGYRTFSSGARARADAARKALMLAADTAIPPQKSSFRGAARLAPRTSTATLMPRIKPSSLA